MAERICLNIKLTWTLSADVGTLIPQTFHYTEGGGLSSASSRLRNFMPNWARNPRATIRLTVSTIMDITKKEMSDGRLAQNKAEIDGVLGLLLLMEKHSVLRIGVRRSGYSLAPFGLV